MKHPIATDPSQSARLQACGVDPNTADMCYVGGWSPVCAIPFSKCNKEDTPAWSLSKLLALLPTSLTSALGNEYMLELSKLRMHNAWEVQWYNGRQRWRTIDKDKKFHKLWDKSPIEACVNAIEYLTQNGYKLNEIKE